MNGEQEHPDLGAALNQRTGQGLAVLATLAEAAARLAVEEMRRREVKEREAAVRDERLDKSRREADRLAQFAAERQSTHDRSVIGRTEDPEWLAKANLKDLGETWRTARTREADFPEAAVAAERVESRLREMYPRPMDLYDQAVAAGVPRADAMRAAAFEMSQTPVMRAHGTRSPSALNASEPIGPEAFDRELGAERANLAAGVDPKVYRTELERLGVGGTAAADALDQVLAARAGGELKQGAANGATPDDPSTLAVDEHEAGLERQSGDLGEANRDFGQAKNAAQLAAEWYPEGMATQSSALPAHVAGKRPATVVAARTQTKAMSR